jgi:glycosyltransferase involved in cell wall biosynthesis
MCTSTLRRPLPRICGSSEAALLSVYTAAIERFSELFKTLYYRVGPAMNILVLEPYYGGSHRAFLDGLIHHLPCSFELLTLPAHSWKWRMRLAAPHFAGVLAEAPHYKDKAFDRILCSSLIDVAALRGLLPAYLRSVPLLTYFHENQFAYPVQVSEARDVHFGLTNLTTALASDGLAFNSRYNLDSFLAGCRELLAKMPDMSLAGYEEAIRAKAVILHPGLDFSGIDSCQAKRQAGRAPVLLWNHRWEHDKNPELFFETLYGLKEQGVPFGLIVLGESFRSQPPVFAQAEQRLAGRILHFGYAKDRQEYCKLLRQGDVVVSTANHEFYGIAVLEAVRAGCRPLVPDRLSYRELFPQEFRYQDGEFAPRLLAAMEAGRLAEDQAGAMTSSFAWPALAESFQRWLASPEPAAKGSRLPLG